MVKHKLEVLAILQLLKSLLHFNKIHFGAASIEKDSYLTPAHNLKVTGLLSSELSQFN